MPAMFDLAGASKRYGSLVALHSTDLHVEPKRTTVLIGPSGCGKSTVLRLMAGLIRPDAGAVLFQGEPIVPDRLPALRRRMGYVIQDGGLFPHLTGLGNVRLLPKHIGWDVSRTTARVRELADLSRLPIDTLDRYPAEMSGGQRQRVSLIRALMLDPDALLLDEPLGALDPMIRFDLQNDLLEIFRRLGKTVVMVTHDLSEAAFFADTIVLMRDGRIVQQGTLRDLIERPAEPFVDTFIRAQRPALELSGGAA
jgi:osmoprotectant transport system ATP-binding protein